MQPLDFVALDFELANGSHASICSLGVTRCTGGVLDEPKHFYIRPEPPYDVAWSMNTRIHGITADQWCDAPTFAQYAESILRNLSGALIVGHGVRNDLSMFTQTLCHAGLGPMPAVTFLDTVDAARAFVPGLPRYTLADVSLGVLGVPHTGHHRADADALASAQILLALIEQGHDVSRFIRSRHAMTRLPKPPRG